LILQPLVENAIKYGIAPAETGGTISIIASLSDDYLIIDVNDTGPGIDENHDIVKSAGIGLKNTEERLKQFYQDDYELRLDNTKEGGFCVQLRVPSS